VSHFTTSPSSRVILPSFVSLSLDTLPASPSTRSVQSQVDAVRGPGAGAPPGARPGARGAGQAARLQQVAVRRGPGAEPGHAGRQRAHGGHRELSGVPGSLELHSLSLTHTHTHTHSEVNYLINCIINCSPKKAHFDSKP